MHPVFASFDLPIIAVPIAWGWGLLAVVAVAIAAIGFKRSKRELMLLGGCLLIAAAASSWLGQGRSVTLGVLRVTSFGALLVLAIAVGYLVVLGFQRVHGLPRGDFERATTFAIVAGMVGARAQYVFDNFGELRSPLEALALQSGGLSGYGGILFGGAAGLLLLRNSALSRAVWADAAAIGCTFGIAVTRLGCYLYGCDFGSPLSETAPGWLRRLGTFPRWEGALAELGSPAWLAHVSSRGLPTSAPFSLPVHPTQLYEATAVLALLVLMIWLRARQKRHGELLVWWVIGYGTVRLLVDGFRDDADRGLWGPALDPGWFVGGGLMLLGLSAILGPLRHLVRPHLATRRGRSLMLPVAAGLVLALALALSRLHPLAPSVVPSTTQWLALTTGLSPALFWRSWTRWTGLAHEATSTPPR